MRLQGLLGIFVFLGIAWLISENRKGVKPATILAGVLLQFAIAGILLYIPFFSRKYSFC